MKSAFVVFEYTSLLATIADQHKATYYNQGFIYMASLMILRNRIKGIKKTENKKKLKE